MMPPRKPDSKPVGRCNLRHCPGRAIIGLLIALCGIVSLSGCGTAIGQTALTPVTGQVLLDGVPVAGVTVYFSSGGLPFSMGKTDSSGNFELTTPELKAAGCIAGRRRIALKPDESVPQVKGSPVIDQVYIERSEYFVDVKSNEKNHFELRLKKRPNLNEWTNPDLVTTST